MLARAIRKNHAERIALLTAKLEQPEFPEALRYIWRAYRRIRRRKGAGMAGPAPIEHRDIEAFQNTTRFRFKPWEVAAIEDLDDAYLMAMAEVQRQEAEGTQSVDDPDQVRDIPRRPVIRKQGGAPP